MIPELSYKNHYKFGYNNDWFNFRTQTSDEWRVQYGRCERIAGSFRSECLETARIISARNPEGVTVLFSGGADSEVVLKSFVEAKLPVKAAVLRFKNELNIHDISYAISTCEKLNVKYHYFDLDILKFWENKLFEYADPTYCISPQLLSTMWLVDQVDEYPVMGSGECLLVKDIPTNYVPGVSPYEKSSWYLWEKEKIAAWYRHFIIRDRNGCPGFFQYTPELMLSYLLDEYVQKLISDQIHGKLSTESSKLKIYQQHFELIDRPKYTGFEKIQDWDAHYRKILTERYMASNEIHKYSVNQLIDDLTYKER